MSDIFISYAREDLDKARPLAAALEAQGWSVFWDRTIPAGKTWREVIGSALAEARAVIVLWSENSVNSTWVLEEADHALQRRVLVPVFIEQVVPPLGFGGIQAANLADWEGDTSAQNFGRLVTDISAMLGPSPRQAEAEAKRKAEAERAQREAEQRAREEARRSAEAEQQRRAAEQSKRKREQQAERARAEAERANQGRLAQRARETEAATEAAPPEAAKTETTARTGRYVGVFVAVIVAVAAIFFVYQQRRESAALTQQLEQTRAEAEAERAAREQAERDAQRRADEARRQAESERAARERADREAQRQAEEARRQAEAAKTQTAKDAAARRQARIEELLGLARRAMVAQRWTTPPGDNALEYFREVLALDPDQPVARAGLERLFTRYMDLFALAMEDRQADKAAAYLEGAARVNPDAPELHDARLRLRQLTAPREAPEPEPDRGEVFRDLLRDGSPGPEMVAIPGRRYAIGRYEVTFDEYDRFAEMARQELPPDMGWGRGNRPVINVSWEDANGYAEWLSKQTHKRYRLPTDEEWDHANRAGTTTQYWWGEEVGRNNANCNGCGSRWDGKQTAPVGSFDPNPFGLYDTAGNVAEWIQDCWEGNCDQRVLRGGSWYARTRSVGSAYRYKLNPADRHGNIGFRLARELD